MDNPQNNFQYFISGLTTTAKAVLLAVLVVLVIVIGFIVYAFTGNRISINQHETTRMSPTQIQTIRNIGEWEFLSISDEELIDTVRYGFFGDDHLARIYYGTLRLGIDLSQLDEQWVEVQDDSVSIQLPPIQLLDEDFIDEAHTRSFYESGKWSHSDREHLYLRAVAAMKERCLVPENVHAAEQNALLQVKQLLNAMGFQRTSITWRKEKKKG